MVSFRTIKRPLFPKPVSCPGLFFAVSYSKRALALSCKNEWTSTDKRPSPVSFPKIKVVYCYFLSGICIQRVLGCRVAVEVVCSSLQYLKVSFFQKVRCFFSNLQISKKIKSIFELFIKQKIEFKFVLFSIGQALHYFVSILFILF